jgi:hypothetical protein
MDARRFAVATVIGGVVLYAAGYLIFDLSFKNFYAANVGSATGVDRGSRIVWAMSVVNLAYAALITYVISHQSSEVTAGAGFRVGAIVGCLA